MAGFGLPNFGQLTEAFKKAKQIQQDAQKLQDELEAMEIEGKSDDEMVTVWISGNQLPLRVEVSEAISNSDKKKIEENILKAMQKRLYRIFFCKFEIKMNFSDPFYILFLIMIGVIYYQFRKPKK